MERAPNSPGSALRAKITRRRIPSGRDARLPLTLPRKRNRSFNAPPPAPTEETPLPPMPSHSKSPNPSRRNTPAPGDNPLRASRSTFRKPGHAPRRPSPCRLRCHRSTPAQRAVQAPPRVLPSHRLSATTDTMSVAALAAQQRPISPHAIDVCSVAPAFGCRRGIFRETPRAQRSLFSRSLTPPSRPPRLPTSATFRCPAPQRLHIRRAGLRRLPASARAARPASHYTARIFRRRAARMPVEAARTTAPRRSHQKPLCQAHQDRITPRPSQFKPGAGIKIPPQSVRRSPAIYIHSRLELLRSLRKELV